MIAFLRGALAMSCVLAGLFFLRFWRESRERLMLVLAGAFFVLGASWTLLAISDAENEANVHIYALRAVAFGLIVAGIIDKNRQSR
ncbi:MAG: DUF5985 family protein [Myxococcota bacterium]